MHNMRQISGLQFVYSREEGALIEIIDGPKWKAFRQIFSVNEEVTRKTLIHSHLRMNCDFVKPSYRFRLWQGDDPIKSLSIGAHRVGFGCGRSAGDHVAWHVGPVRWVEICGELQPINLVGS